MGQPTGLSWATEFSGWVRGGEWVWGLALAWVGPWPEGEA